MRRTTAFLFVAALALVSGARAWNVGDCLALLSVADGSLSSSVRLSYRNGKTAVAVTTKSTTPAGVSGALPVAFPASGGACSFTSASDVAAVSGAAGATEVGASGDSRYQLSFDDTVSRFNVTSSSKTIGAVVVVSGLVLDIKAQSKVALLAGKAVKLPMSVSIAAGTASIYLDFKVKTGTGSIASTIPLAGKAPAKAPSCSLLLSTAGTFTFSCTSLGLSLGTLPATDGVPSGGTLTALVALTAAKVTASSDIASVVQAKSDDPVAVKDVGTYSAQSQQCTAYSLVNDDIPDMDNTRIYMNCDGTGELELESIPADRDAAPTYAPGCDTPLNGSIEWTNFAYQGTDDPSYNGTLFKQVYYFLYSPPDSWSSAFSYTFTYTLKRKGASSSATVTCSMPTRPGGAVPAKLAAAWRRAARRGSVGATASLAAAVARGDAAAEAVPEEAAP